MLVFPTLTHIYVRWYEEDERVSGSGKVEPTTPFSSQISQLVKASPNITHFTPLFQISFQCQRLVHAWCPLFYLASLWLSTIFLSVSTQHSAGKRQMRWKHIFTNYEMVKMMNDGIDDIDKPNNWNLCVSPCQYRYRVPSKPKKMLSKI